jgi:hypothetical protein
LSPHGARAGKVPFIVDMALAADARHRGFAHQVLDRFDQRGFRPAASTLICAQALQVRRADRTIGAKTLAITVLDA